MNPPTESFRSRGLIFRNSTIHGFGCYASKPISPGTWIIQYVGQRINKAESARRCAENNEFIFTLNDDFDIDGNVGWNPAKFINHSCAPNCEAENVDDQIWIVAKRAIAEGEELTFNYGYDVEDYRKHPCRCGAASCVGFIVAEEFHALVRLENSGGTAPPPHEAETIATR